MCKDQNPNIFPEDDLETQVDNLKAELQEMSSNYRSLWTQFHDRWRYLIAILAAVNSALYLTALFVIALLTGNLPAAVCAVFTFGVCFLSYTAQIMWPSRRAVHMFFVALSILMGIAGGVLLILE